jgi:hypothetical protein
VSIPDPKFGSDVLSMMRELDDTAIIEMVCAADKVWGERYGDSRTQVPRCACCHTNGFASGAFVWEICKKCQHHNDVHGPR